jgi:hypothetical protein
MATLVQQSAAIAFSTALSNTTAGDLLVLCINTNGGVSAVSDGVNTWVHAVTSTSGGSNTSQIWYAENIVHTAGTLTVTITGGGGPVLWLSEWSGIATSSSLESTNTIAGLVSGPVLGPSLTNTHNADLLICVTTPDHVNATAVSAPWTGMVVTSGIIWGAYYLPGSTVTSQATFNVSDTYSSSGAVFSAPVAPPPANTSLMFLVF